jgi:hypothetical protein
VGRIPLWYHSCQSEYYPRFINESESFLFEINPLGYGRISIENKEILRADLFNFVTPHLTTYRRSFNNYRNDSKHHLPIFLVYHFSQMIPGL